MVAKSKRKMDAALSTAGSSPSSQSIQVPSSDIARCAYDRYVARGYTPGYDLDDWLESERELKAAATAG